MTPEQQALLDKARDSVRAAELLVTSGLFDFAVSRAYYAMFYVAQALLLGEGLAFSKHAGVIAAFGKQFAKTGRVPAEYHRYLIEGQSKRTIGDYTVRSGLSRADADEQIRRARLFIDLGDKMLGAP